jgi:hypothetical protein
MHLRCIRELHLGFTPGDVVGTNQVPAPRQAGS